MLTKGFSQVSKNFLMRSYAKLNSKYSILTVTANEGSPQSLDNIALSLLEETGIKSKLLTDHQKPKKNMSLDFKLETKELAQLNAIKHKLEEHGLQVQESSPLQMEWFPTQESDLDFIGNEYQDLSTGPNQDHPGFTDREYVERRNFVGGQGLGYKMGDPIPDIEYTAQETQFWGDYGKRLEPLHKKFGCKEYKENLKTLQKDGYMNPERIPQLEELNQYLKNVTNWRIKPVNGILSQKEFLYCLAFRTFACTQYIRHESQPNFTPEPDFFHEFMGHLPMFSDPTMCDLSQLIGILSLGADDEQIARLGSIYWFTIEIGLCYEENQRKFYGATVASSYAETMNMAGCEDIRKLDLVHNPPPVEFGVLDVQPFYYAANSFHDALDQLEVLAKNIFKKPFNLEYDEKTNSFEIDRFIEMYGKPEIFGEE
jgi:phenylalanine-4-hydroxylase